MGLISNDNELIYMVIQKSDEALEMLVAKYKKVIWALVHGFNFNFKCNEDKMDLYQQCLIALYDSVYNYREDKEANYGTYIRGCLKKTILAYMRRQRLHKNSIFNKSVSLDACMSESEFLYGIDLIENNICEYDPIWMLNFNDINANVKKVLQECKENEALAYNMKLKGYTYKEISDALNISVKKVDNSIQKIKKKLLSN